jgi:predicted transcriptional regulator
MSEASASASVPDSIRDELAQLTLELCRNSQRDVPRGGDRHVDPAPLRAGGGEAGDAHAGTAGVEASDDHRARKGIMTMTIEFPPELKRKLDETARRQGTTPDALVVTIVRDQLLSEERTKPADAAPRNLAERLKGYVGVLHSSEHVPGGAQMSERTGEKFTEILLQRRREGRL